MPIPKCFVSILLKAEGKEEEEDEEKNPLIKKNQIFKMVFSEAFAKKVYEEQIFPEGHDKIY